MGIQISRGRIILSKSIKEKIKQFFSPKGSSWFLSPGLANRGEKQVISDLERYAKSVSESIRLLEEAMQAYTQYEPTLFDLHIDNIIKGWVKAEKIRESLINNIAIKRLFFPDSRESMLELINSMNMALMLTAELRFLTLPKQQNHKTFSIKKITDQCLELAELIPSGVKYLNEDPKHSVRVSHRSIDLELEIATLMKDAKTEIEDLPENERLLMIDLLKQLSAIFRALINVINQIQEIAIKFV